MSNFRVMRALEAFEAAQTVKDYSRAKRFAAQCETVEQLAMVDSMRAALRRVR